MNSSCSRAIAWRLAHAAGVAAEQRAGGDILEHGHVRKRLHDLERAREAERARSGTGFGA